MSTASIAALATPLIAALIGMPAADDDDRRPVTVRSGPVDQVIDDTVDNLEDGDVLAIVVTDGEPGARGSVRQCRLGTDGVTGCHNSYPILFDDDGIATFQYQLRDRGTCGADAICVVVASTDDEIAMAFTVFGEEARPPPTVRLTPRGPLQPGSTVHVQASGLIPGAPAQAAFCDEACARAERAVAGPDGTVRFDVDVAGPCRCTIVVVGGATVTRTALTFVPAPSARYDTWRLVAGLAACVAFLLVAWRLITTTDWRPPSEAATPELES